MSTRFESAKDFFEIIKNISFIIAAIIGAWWALKTYIYQNPNFYETGWTVANHVNGEINVKELMSGSNLNYGTVEIKLNTQGYLDQIVDLNNNALKVSEISKIKNGIPIIDTTINYYAISSDEKQDNQKVPSKIVDQKFTQEIDFLIQFPKPGIYLIEFSPCTVENRNECYIQKYFYYSPDKRKN